MSNMSNLRTPGRLRRHPNSRGERMARRAWENRSRYAEFQLEAPAPAPAPMQTVGTDVSRSPERGVHLDVASEHTL